MAITRAIAGVAIAIAAILAPRATSAATLTTIYSFAGGNDGGEPTGSLTYLDGMLYGTSSTGGYLGFAQTYGTVFKLDPVTGTETVLHAFTNGTDSAFPQSNLLYHAGFLYGTSSGDVDEGYPGALFKVDPATGAFSVLWDFGNRLPDAELPYAGVILSGGKLYGVSTSGGPGGLGGPGTIFTFDLVHDIESVAYSFTGEPDGSTPFGNLITESDAFYGTTEAGGTANLGTVFKFDPKSGTETILHSFGVGTDGAGPFGGLIDVGGILYGTTQSGGASNLGTLFQIDPMTGTETVLYSFSGATDGEYPLSTLLHRGGNLYGTTIRGGSGTWGTVFEFNVKKGKLKVLYGFSDGVDGGSPYSGLIYEGGAFYGTTAYGGASGHGTVFKLLP
jgi:uncharacterized repeat protein (TIGR03803 family)